MSEGKRAASVREAKAREEGAALCLHYQAAVEFIGRRWMGAIVFVLLKGPHRFNELLSAVPGISDRLLTERLRELQAHGMIVRRVIPESPVRVEYELTEAGRGLHDVVSAVSDWAHKWFPRTKGIRRQPRPAPNV